MDDRTDRMFRLMAPGLLALGLALAFPAGAGVYQWTDAQGRVHFTDTPPRLITPYRLGLLAEQRAERARKARQPAPAKGPSPVERLRLRIHAALQQQRREARPRLVRLRGPQPQSDELCGLYRVSADQYQARLRDCQGRACEIYRRQLDRFRDKTRRFCGSRPS